jgi:hypothetical protein
MIRCAAGHHVLFVQIEPEDAFVALAIDDASVRNRRAMPP